MLLTAGKRLIQNFGVQIQLFVHSDKAHSDLQVICHNPFYLKPRHWIQKYLAVKLFISLFTSNSQRVEIKFSFLFVIEVGISNLTRPKRIPACVGNMKILIIIHKQMMLGLRVGTNFPDKTLVCIRSRSTPFLEKYSQKW